MTTTALPDISPITVMSAAAANASAEHERESD